MPTGRDLTAGRRGCVGPVTITRRTAGRQNNSVLFWRISRPSDGVKHWGNSMLRYGKQVLVVCLTVGLFSTAVNPAKATFITMSEARTTGVLFNGQLGEVLLSSDGEYRVEFFFLNNTGHSHVSFVGGASGFAEVNHNYSKFFTPAETQGLRITRVDGGLFNFDSMTLHGSVAIGNFTDFTRGGGRFNLAIGNPIGSTPANPTTTSFGGFYHNLSSIVFADPARAGGSSETNYWDNIQLTRSTPNAVPAPAGAVLLGIGAGCLGLFRSFRRLTATAKA